MKQLCVSYYLLEVASLITFLLIYTLKSVTCVIVFTFLSKSFIFCRLTLILNLEIKLKTFLFVAMQDTHTVALVLPMLINKWIQLLRK